MKNIIIDTNKKPFVPEGWTIESHTTMGKIDLADTELYLSEKQKSGIVEGSKLLKELADKEPLNVTVLDYLLKHQELIPEEWKSKNIFFWATIYRDTYGYLCVRFLYWGADDWRWSCRWLSRRWYGDGPTLMRASTKMSPLSLDARVAALEQRVKRLEKRKKK